MIYIYCFYNRIASKNAIRINISDYVDSITMLYSITLGFAITIKYTFCSLLLKLVKFEQWNHLDRSHRYI